MGCRSIELFVRISEKADARITERSDQFLAAGDRCFGLDATADRLVGCVEVTSGGFQKSVMLRPLIGDHVAETAVAGVEYLDAVKACGTLDRHRITEGMRLIDQSPNRVKLFTHNDETLIHHIGKRAKKVLGTREQSPL